MKVPLIINKIHLASRADDWRFSFVPFIIGCVYLWLFYFDITFSLDALVLIVLSLTTTFGFAALGYFINEYFDQDADLKAFKINKLSLLKAQQQLLLFSVIIALTFLPWLKLPFTHYTLILISFEIGLFFVYSFPFPRLKNSPVAAPLIDAAYAYVTPLILSYYTYTLFISVDFDFTIFPLLAAVFFIGLRNILIHHVNDIFKDKRSGQKTLPQILGIQRTSLLILFFLLHEFIFMVLFTFLFTQKKTTFLLWLLFYPLWMIFRWFQLKPHETWTYFSIRKLRHLTDFAYQFWLPLLALILLVIQDFKWLILIPFHLLILVEKNILNDAWNYLIYQIAPAIKRSYHWVRGKWIRPAISIIINYPIYFFFLLFGVNLAKEKKSAWQYLKSAFFK